MGASFNETMREVEEESGITRGGARFRQDKMQSIGEGPVAIKIQYREGRPHGTKRTYDDEEDD